MQLYQIVKMFRLVYSTQCSRNNLKRAWYSKIWCY